MVSAFRLGTSGHVASLSCQHETFKRPATLHHAADQHPYPLPRRHRHRRRATPGQSGLDAETSCHWRKDNIRRFTALNYVDNDMV